MALLEVKGITKVFGGLVAVEKVEFKVNEGEIVSIIGTQWRREDHYF